MRTTAVERAAGALIALEGLALLVLLGWQIVALVAGDTDSATSAIALIVLTALGAVAVIAFGAAVWRGHSWGRSGGVVTQLLILAVAFGAATGAYGHPAVAAAIGAPAIVVLVLLVAAARAAARRHTDVDAA